MTIRFPASRLATKGASLEMPMLSQVAELQHANVEFKADNIDSEARTFEGLASVWGLDLGDDVMHRGAFKDTIAEWKKSKDALPLLNSHNHYDVLSAVGQLLDARETKDGLWTKWEVIDGPDGDAVLQRLRPSARTGRAPVSKMSIGYEPAKFDMEESDQARYGIVRNLRKVNLKEVSLVIFPMAPGARIDVQSVKSLSIAAADEFMLMLRATRPESAPNELKLKVRQVASLCGPFCKTAPSAPAAPSGSTPSPTSPTPAAPADASADPASGDDEEEKSGTPATPDGQDSAAPPADGSTASTSAAPPAPTPAAPDAAADSKLYNGLPASLFVEAVQHAADIQLAEFKAYMEKYHANE